MAERFNRVGNALRVLATPVFSMLLCAAFLIVHWYIGAVLGEGFEFKHTTMRPGLFSWVLLAVAVGMIICAIVLVMREIRAKSD
jgi:hypothetical protein